jgi:hypothetical protein
MYTSVVRLRQGRTSDASSDMDSLHNKLGHDDKAVHFVAFLPMYCFGEYKMEYILVAQQGRGMPQVPVTRTERVRILKEQLHSQKKYLFDEVS